MIHIKHVRGPLAATILSVISLAFAGPTASAESDALVVANGSQPPSLDPHVSTATTTNILARNIFETLLTLDANMQIQPGLAESWNVSEDGRTYRFTLRPGVKFHNGRALTPQDVIASLERWEAYSQPGKNIFQGATWTAEGENTVALQLPVPRFNALQTLAPLFAQSAVIMPAEIVAAAGDKPVTEIVGTGPFRLVDWQADRMMELERYDKYTSFGGKQSGTAGNRTPAFDKLRVEFVPDESTRTLGLSTGEYDLVNPVAFDNISEIQANESLKLGSFPGVLLNVGFNYGKPGIFHDIRARRAVSVGVERQSILAAAAVDPKFFRLNNHLMLLAQKQWAPNVGETEFNPADAGKAKELLKEAGYDGSELTLITSRDFAEMYNSAIVIQQQLQGLGLNVKVESYDWSTFVKVRADKNAWDLIIMAAVPKADPTQLIFLNKDLPGGAQDAGLEKILTKFRNAKTTEEAQKLYGDLDAWNQEYIPSVRIGEVDYPFAMSKRVEGLQVQYEPIPWTVRLTD
ncbi:ABC transporter substrate-binding protein [Ensifer sp. BR816]|uniref:ABC transporter substrate-binding protein n=1 Tax=Rhizobium sp. (strain BR816) TaxID=1057002 RepID=UPI00035EC2D9|nr:ABC transporter substrate-binding protein [Ensifer sp. BR816]